MWQELHTLNKVERSCLFLEAIGVNVQLHASIARDLPLHWVKGARLAGRGFLYGDLPFDEFPLGGSDTSTLSWLLSAGAFSAVTSARRLLALSADWRGFFEDPPFEESPAPPGAARLVFDESMQTVFGCR